MGLGKTILFVGGRLVTAIIGVLGFACDLTGKNLPALSSHNLGIIGLLAFIIFILLTLVREVNLIWEQRPNVIVRPEIHSGRATLVVTNTGGAGNFTAKARAIASIPAPALYTMCWESISTISCPVDGDGGTASILVAEKAKFNYKGEDVSTSFFAGDLILFKMGVSGSQMFPAFSGKTRTEIVDGQECISGTSVERCILEITITAAQTLKKKWGTRKYLCEIEEGQIKLSETDLSSPHIVDT